MLPYLFPCHLSGLVFKSILSCNGNTGILYFDLQWLNAVLFLNLLNSQLLRFVQSVF